METISDYRTELVQAGTVLDKTETVVLRDGPYVRALKRLTRNEHLFLYYHRGARTFVLAAWLGTAGKRIRACIEVEALRSKPEWGGWSSVTEMATRIKITHSAQKQALRDKIQEARAEEAAKEAEADEYRRGVGKVLRRQGLVDSAMMIENQSVPFEKISDDEWKELSGKAVGRITSVPNMTPKHRIMKLVDRFGKALPN